MIFDWFTFVLQYPKMSVSGERKRDKDASGADNGSAALSDGVPASGVFTTNR
jgi:hypothetical protein